MVIKIYEFGDPSLIDEDEPYIYFMALLYAGDNLVAYWDSHVKAYFSRSTPDYFTKGGKFKMHAASKSSSLQGALEKPRVMNTRKCGIPLRDIVKTSDNGDICHLINILRNGSSPKMGIHYDPTTGKMQKGGTYKGFSSGYWKRWDNAFTLQMRREEGNLQGYMDRIVAKGDQYFKDDGSQYQSHKEIVSDYANSVIPSIRNMVNKS